MVTFDDPAGVYAPGDVVENGVHVWTPDAFKFTVANWDTSDSDNEINQRDQGKIIVIELSSGANFDFVSIYGQGGWGFVRFVGYNAAGDAIVSFSFQHTTCAGCPGSTIFLPSAFDSVAKVTLETPTDGAGVIDIHHWDDITLEFDSNQDDSHTFTRMELLEISAVPIPMNPSALRVLRARDSSTFLFIAGGQTPFF